MSDARTKTESPVEGTFTLKVPDVGEGVAEVEIVTWEVKVGDKVTRLQTVAEVMTDKATVEVPSPVDGVVAELGGAVGDVLLVGSPLMRLTVGGGSTRRPEPEETEPTQIEAIDQKIELTEQEVATNEPFSIPEIETLRSSEPPPGVELRPHVTGAPVVSESAAAEPVAERRRPVVPERQSHPDRISVLATPAVRRRARDLGVDLRRVGAAGLASGPAGRITHEDLDAYLAGPKSNGRAGAAGPVGRTARTGSTQQPVVGLRRRIAQQMSASATTIPHITYVEEVDVTALEDLRSALNRKASATEGQPRLTVLPFLVRALTNTLVEFPQINAHLNDEAGDGKHTLTVHEGVHVGIATQTDNGLVVPVLRHAEAHTIWSTAAAITELSEATRAGRVGAGDLAGSTITITSLGPLGGIVTTPIINKPEVAIVGVNKIVVRPVWVDGEFVPRKMMNLSSSFDHRVVDGWDAANFVQSIRAQLEQPALLFIDDFAAEPVDDSAQSE